MASAPVKLYVYDLSQGMAKQMSLSLTGKQINGIWHTSVVIFGHEYYYGQGIECATPGGTHHGSPLEVIDMGETYLPEEVVIEYIDSLREVFTAEKYHLLDFNCNTFSNNLCQFLTGRTIPAHITDLPADFVNTPFGQSILPMIEGMFGKSKIQTNAPLAAPAGAPSSASMGMLRDVTSAALSAAAPAPQPVQYAQNVAALERWIQSHKAVIVFFTSASCPPCRMIKPEFERLMQEKNADSQKIKILGVIVDTSMAYDAAAKYGIRATPTFILFHNGQKFSDFKGANYAELKSSVDFLLFTAFPPHPHRKIQLRAIDTLPNKPVLYNTVGKLDLVYSKLQEFLTQANVSLTPDQRATVDQSKRILEKTEQDTALDMDRWHSLTDTVLDKLPIDQQFPFLDIFRLILTTKNAAAYYTKDCSQLVKIMENGYKNSDVPKGTMLMTLRVACNVFAHDTLVTTYFTSNLPVSSHRSTLTQLLVTCLLSQESQVRQAAGALAFNCSTIIANERREKEKNQGYLDGIPEQEDDDWQIEVVSAVMDVLTKETDEEVLHRLLAATGNFLFLASTETSLSDLLTALDIVGILDEKIQNKVISSPKVINVARDLQRLVRQS